MHAQFLLFLPAPPSPSPAPRAAPPTPTVFSRRPGRLRRTCVSCDLPAVAPLLRLLRCLRPAGRLLAASADGGAAEAMPPSFERHSNDVTSGDAYLGLFVRMLGLDNDPLDREQAIVTLWKYSQRGRECIDGIMQFPGCINLVVSLLKSESSSSCEAAVGLLRSVTSVKLHRDVVSESGAIEEIFSLLCQPSITLEVKEQCLCVLWNLSIDENHRLTIAKNDLLPELVRFLDDEEIKVKEAAGGLIANLALSPCNHGILFEAGVIPKLANLLKCNEDGYKIIRKEAKTALLEFCKDDYYRIVITEEGLVRVPVVGSAVYKAFRPVTHSWPSLPDGTEIQRSERPTRYGASDLLLGLNVDEKNLKLEEAKMNAIVGRSQQQFLARIGAIEIEDGGDGQSQSLQNEQYTLLSWIDGVARIVLILGLGDVSAVAKAAYSIADAAINEHMHVSFKEAGAVRRLVQLLHHGNETVREAVAHALDKLSMSYTVCKVIESEGALEPLINILKDPDTPAGMLQKTIHIISRILEMDRGMKLVFGDKVDRSEEPLKATGGSSDTSLSQVEASRKWIGDSAAISRLVVLLREASPSLQAEVVSILEYLVTFEGHAATITAIGIGTALYSVLQRGALNVGWGDDFDNQPELTAVEFEEIGLSTSAAARLLAKLLNFEHFYDSIDPRTFIVLLRKILKSSIPLHAKDWVAACLIKLESRVGSVADQPYNNVEVEVTIYETIPRLVERMSTSFIYEDRSAAVLELKRIISGGVMEYTRAIANAGGIFALVKLIEEGSGDSFEASLAVLYNLSMDAENHSAIIAAGAVPLLKRIVLSEGPQWTRALHLLRTLPT